MASFYTIEYHLKQNRVLKNSDLKDLKAFSVVSMPARGGFPFISFK
jgi:hypothetical protein